MSNKEKKKEYVRQVGLKAMKQGKVDPARGHSPQRFGREILKGAAADRAVRKAMEKELTRMGEDAELAEGKMKDIVTDREETARLAAQEKEPPFTPDKTAVRRGRGGPMSQAKWLAKQAMTKKMKEMGMKEEVEQVEEGDLSIRTLYNKYADHYTSDKGNSAKRADAVGKAITKVHGPKVMKHLEKAVKANLRGDMDQEENHFERARNTAEKSGSDRVGATVGRDRSKFRKEEVEQTDEALLPKQQAVADKLKASELAANKEKAGYKFGKDLRAAKVAAVHKSMEREMQKESVEYIEEKLTAADPASEWIKDFVASDNPKFEGKSKKERINMALGAYYAAKRAGDMKEGFDPSSAEIAKMLVKKHGTGNVTKQHILDLESDRDSIKGFDHDEIMKHVKKMGEEVEQIEVEKIDEVNTRVVNKEVKKEKAVGAAMAAARRAKNTRNKVETEPKLDMDVSDVEKKYVTKV
jgi:hypothetical protein